MKKTLIYALAASVAVLASCAKEATVKEAPAKETVPCTISFGADTTKSYMNSSGITWWTKGDQISVFSDQGTRKTFTSTLSSSDASSDFTCEDWVSDEIPEWAVFCYEEKATPYKPYNVTETTEGVFAANVSCYQPITVRNMGSFGSKANISVAKITNNQGTYNGTMKNALGLVKITIPSGIQNVNEIILEDAAGTAPIAGNVTIDCTGDDPVCTPTGENGKSSISAKCNISGATAFTASKSVYFCVVPGVSFTPKFTFVKTDGSKASVTGSKAISVSRNKYFDCGTPSSLDFVPEGYKKVVVDLTFGTNPFNESIPASSKWNAEAKTLELTHTTADGYTFKYALKNSDVADATGKYSSYKLDTANSLLLFYGNARADGTEYFQIDRPDGGKIASISVSISTAAKTMYVTDLSGDVIESPKTPFTTNLTGTNAADGCRLKYTKSDYKINDIKVTYFVPEATE